MDVGDSISSVKRAIDSDVVGKIERGARICLDDELRDVGDVVGYGNKAHSLGRLLFLGATFLLSTPSSRAKTRRSVSLSSGREVALCQWKENVPNQR